MSIFTDKIKETQGGLKIDPQAINPYASQPQDANAAVPATQISESPQPNISKVAVQPVAQAAIPETYGAENIQSDLLSKDPERIKKAQSAIGVKADGVVGKKTTNAFNSKYGQSSGALSSGLIKNGTSSGYSKQESVNKDAPQILKDADKKLQDLSNQAATPSPDFTPEKLTAEDLTPPQSYKDFADYVRATKPPSMDDAIRGYDETMKRTKDDQAQVERNKKWGMLGDLGLLVGDYIGAKGGANVNVRQPITQEFNDKSQKLTDIYRQYQAEKPTKVAALQLEDYKNKLAQAKNAFEADKLTEEYIQQQKENLQKHNELLLKAHKDKDDAKAKQEEIQIKALIARINGAGKTLTHSEHQAELGLGWANHNLAAQRFAYDKEKEALVLSDYEGKEHVVPKNKEMSVISNMFGELLRNRPEIANTYYKKDANGNLIPPTYNQMRDAVLLEGGNHIHPLRYLEATQSNDPIPFPEKVDYSKYQKSNNPFAEYGGEIIQ